MDGGTKDPTNSDVLAPTQLVSDHRAAQVVIAPGDRLYASSLLDRAYVEEQLRAESTEAAPSACMHIHDKYN